MSALDDQRDPSPPEVTPLSNQQEPAQLSTPPGELNGVDAKTSRKREREVSVEPATPQATTALDVESGNADSKERRTPAKKNRTSAGALEATQEETEDEAGTSGSPPHETKIRQISQGVEDITWRQMRKDAPTDGEHKMDEDTSSAAQREQGTGDSTPTKVPESTSAGDSENGSQEPIELPPLLRGENPPIVDDMAGDIEDTGAAAGAEQPADSHVPGAPEPATAQVPDPESASTAAAPEVKPSRIPRLPPHRRDSDSDQEKGLKRKLGDRTVSERLLPGETVPGLSGAPAVAATKRPRDDPEEDPNSREKKRPTPPPEEDEKKDEPKAAAPAETRSAFGGFMAYASTSSPFASVNGPKVVGSKQSTPSPRASAASQSSTSFFASSGASAFASAASKDKNAADAAPSTPSAQKRTGFEAFASVNSPFASAAKRPKSPPPPSSSSSMLGRSRSPSRHGTPGRPTSAFSAYAGGGAQGFAAASSKRRSGSSTPALGESSSTNVLVGSAEGSVLDTGRDDDSEKDSGVSFGERLREAKDKDQEDEQSEEEKKLNLQQQEVHTGEEDEDTVYQVRGKLFALSPQNQWKERGTGTLRLNVRREDGGGARLVMRKEAVYTVLLNATLFKGMRCFLAQDPRYIRFSVIEGAVTTHYNLRVQSAKVAEELLEEINAHIPTD